MGDGMRTALIERGVPAVAALLGSLVIGLWVRGWLSAPLLPARPLGTEPPPRAAGKPPPAAPAGTTAVPPPPDAAPARAAAPASGPEPAAAARVPLLPGLWPGFRGPARDNVARDAGSLSRDWSARPPRLLWSVSVGEGYAGPAVRAGRVYLLDYDQAGQADTLRCFALSDGRELWRQAYHVVVKRSHGMSRTVPAVTEKWVVTLGPKCHVQCVDALTGQRRWLKDLVAEFGATVPEWYAGQCPLIDRDRAIIAPGGKALMIAVELATGRVLWQTPNPRGWTMTHSSILPVDYGGRRIYVYCASGGVVGVDSGTGRLLWEFPEWVINTATVPSPVHLGGGHLFLTGGYGAGSLVLQLREEGGRMAVTVAARIDPAVFGSEQHTPILHGGHLYGVASDGQMACLDLSGRRIWSSGTQNRFGLGPYLLADGLLLILAENGSLVAAEASPAAFNPLGRHAILPEGEEAWAPLALAGTRLLARDLTRLVCVDLGR